MYDRNNMEEQVRSRCANIVFDDAAVFRLSDLFCLEKISMRRFQKRVSILGTRTLTRLKSAQNCKQFFRKSLYVTTEICVCSKFPHWKNLIRRRFIFFKWKDLPLTIF